MPDWLTQRNHAPDRDTATVDGWHERQVANPTFLLERLGSECTDLQGLRELTVNGLDAIAAQGTNSSGRIVWDLDWHRFDASGGRVRKLSVTDTGTGMTPEQLRQYINQLASSGSEQSASGNFGVGAKVAAGCRNPHGLEYRSWHHGQGALVCFKRHPDGRWGLEPQRWPDGRSDFWRPLDEADKPWLLRDRDRGTQVVLLGRHERHDTTQAPDSVTKGRRQWITRYLNARFLRLPSQVEVLVREQHGRDQPGQLQPIRGEKHHLQQRTIADGLVQLTDAVAHWWVLDDDRRARRREGTLWASTGHAAAVYGDELYDVLPATRGGYGRLQDFGIRFGYERVVLHLEPHVQPGHLQCNTARTLLLLDHEPPPWTRWGEEFASAMPDEIRRLQERAANADCVPRRKAIRNRISAIMPLYHLSRYRPAQPPRQPSAELAASNPSDEPAGRLATRSQASGTPPAPSSMRALAGAESGRDASGSEPAAERADRHPRSDAAVDLPDVAWIPHATGPERRATSRTRQPATTPAATSSRSTRSSERSPTSSPTGAVVTQACPAPGG